MDSTLGSLYPTGPPLKLPENDFYDGGGMGSSHYDAAFSAGYHGNGMQGEMYDDGYPPRTPPMQAHHPVLRPERSYEGLGPRAASSASSSSASLTNAVSTSRAAPNGTADSGTKGDGGSDHGSGTSRRHGQQPQHRRPQRRIKAPRAGVQPSLGDAVIVAMMDGGGPIGRNPEIAAEAARCPLPPLEESEDEYDDSPVFYADDYDHVGASPGGAMNSVESEDEASAYDQDGKDEGMGAQLHRQRGAAFDKERVTSGPYGQGYGFGNVGRGMSAYDDEHVAARAGGGSHAERWENQQLGPSDSLWADEKRSAKNGGSVPHASAGGSNVHRQGSGGSKVQKRKQQGVHEPRGSPKGPRGGAGSPNVSSTTSSHGRRFALGLASLRKATTFHQARSSGRGGEGGGRAGGRGGEGGAGSNHGYASSVTLRGDDEHAYTPSDGGSSVPGVSLFEQSPGN